MSVLTPEVVPSNMKFASVNMAQLQNGNWEIQGLRIFRAGTFKDSMGVQRTWETEHLEQMVFNFGMLRDSGKFPNVPVRSDHSFSVDKVVGYITELRREENFLVANIEVTNPDAKEKIDRGHYRSRSLEVGAYETNDEALYWPTVMGLAFVDIPAVEGLHSKPKSKEVLATFSQFMQDEDKESLVADNNTNEGTEGQTKPTEEGGTDTTKQQPVPTAPAEGEATPAEGTPAPTTEEGGETGDGEEGVASHSRTHAFRVNGAQVSDFAAVQAHIDLLEGFAQETQKAARENFVKELAETNRIAATQLEDMTSLALGMSDDQFTAFRSAYEKAPAASIFGNFGHVNGGQAPSEPDATDKLTILEERVAMHRRSGMSEENLQKTDSFKQLTELKNSGAAV